MTKREKELYRQVFNKTIKVYQELKSITGSLSCTGLYQSIGRQGVGKTAFNSSIIRPLPSDFICEIEKIVSVNLDSIDYQLFHDHFYEENTNGTEWRINKHRIQEKLGRLFITQGIHPIEAYFKPKDIR